MSDRLTPGHEHGLVYERATARRGPVAQTSAWKIKTCPTCGELPEHLGGGNYGCGRHMGTTYVRDFVSVDVLPAGALRVRRDRLVRAMLDRYERDWALFRDPDYLPNSSSLREPLTRAEMRPIFEDLVGHALSLGLPDEEGEPGGLTREEAEGLWLVLFHGRSAARAHRFNLDAYRAGVTKLKALAGRGES